MAKITTPAETWEDEQTLAHEGAANASAGGGVRGFLTGPYPTLISRLVLGGIMLLAGLTKIGVPATMATSIRAYQIPLPDFLVDIMAVGLPVLEVAIGAWLLLGLFTRFSAITAAGLMLVFTVAITSAWMRGLDIDCGCFAGAEANSLGLGIMNALGPIGTYLANEKANLETIARDVVLTLMGVHLFLVPSIFSLDTLRRRGANEAEEVEED